MALAQNVNNMHAHTKVIAIIDLGLKLAPKLTIVWP